MAYEHQSGNKNLLFVASHQVSSETIRSEERVEAALKIISTKAEVQTATEVIQKDPRFVIQQVQDESQNSWDEMTLQDLVEFAAVFVFEVYLEKQIHYLGPASMTVNLAPVTHEAVKPSDVPIEAPTTHDVLFGRGKNTREHSGNLRCNLLIEMYAEQYESANKVQKTVIAERIVAMVHESLGRFLKQEANKGWVEVSDDAAREKISHFFRFQRSKRVSNGESQDTKSAQAHATKRVTPCPSPSLSSQPEPKRQVAI